MGTDPDLRAALERLIVQWRERDDLAACLDGDTDQPCDGMQQCANELSEILAVVRAPQRQEKPDERTIRGLVGTLQTVLPRDLYMQIARYFSDRPFDPGSSSRPPSSEQKR